MSSRAFDLSYYSRFWKRDHVLIASFMLAWPIVVLLVSALPPTVPVILYKVAMSGNLANTIQLLIVLSLAYTISAYAVSLFLSTISGGAKEVDFDDLGFSLHFPSGRVSRYNWSDPMFNLVIIEQPRLQGKVGKGQIAGGLLGWPPVTLLSEEAEQAILEGASAHGLQISRKQSSLSLAGLLVKVHIHANNRKNRAISIP